MATLILAAAAAGLLSWRVYTVRRVRYDRLSEVQHTFRHLADKPEAMTYQEAAEIMKLTHYWDFPWTAALSLSFALFKTYAIPSISSVLNRTGELGSLDNAGRRAEDTGLFIAEFLSQGLDSERGSVSIARMNYLHSRWGPSIKQDDLLFTLALFVFEPITVIGKYEWRALTPLEEQARYVFWREIGARMGIENIPTTREAFWKWKEDYADRAMVYDAGNAQTGEATLAVLLRPFPDFLKPFVREASLVLIDDRTRNAFGWAPASPRFLYILVPAVLRLRAAFIGNLMMPRNDLPPMFKTHTKDDGSYVREGFLFEPWYIPAGYSSIGMFGIGKPGLPKFGSGKGWRPQTLGPDRLHDQGVDRSLADAAKMREAARICPFFRD